ncbi:MAG: tetratricopeptide repeat protein [Bacteroidota bacterium]
MFQLLERGNILFHQGRYQAAEKEYFKILAEDPNNPFALAMVAQCYLETNRKKEALDFAHRAVKASPDSPTLYSVLAQCQLYNYQLDEAMRTVQSGQQLDPGNSDFFLLKSQIAFRREDWATALAEAENGLEIDPEEVNLINLRARALVKLNRSEEASQTMDFALHQAPQSSYSHANKGWVSIERDAYDEAIVHFKEALRLEATNAYAKAGLREAIKAKNVLYRGVLKYFLWMGKLQEKYRWGFVIGIYVLYRIALALAETSDLMAMIMTPLIIFYVLFAFSSWIAMPISNLFLRLHPLGKYALEEDEVQASTLVGALGAGSLLTFLLFFLTGGGIDTTGDNFQIDGYGQLFVLGIMLFLMMIPVSGVFSAEAGTKARKNLVWLSAGLAAVGALSLITDNGTLVTLFFLGILGYSFIASYLISRSARE